MKQYFAPCALMALTACNSAPSGYVTVPDNDPTLPTITVSMFDPDERPVASTDPTVTVSRGCPAGTKSFIILVDEYFDRIEPAFVPAIDPNGYEEDFYFYDSANPLRFRIVVTDPEGIYNSRIVAHAHDADDARTGDFGTRGGAPTNPFPTDAESYSDTDFYGFTSSILLPGHGKFPIYVYDRREDFIPEFDDAGNLTSELAPTRYEMIIDPVSLSGGPVFYVEARSAATDSNGINPATQLVVRLLPQELCRDETLQP